MSIASMTKAATGQTCFQRYTALGERRVARALVERILSHGCLISVDDGEEFTLARSTSKKAVLDALATTGEDTLHIRDAHGGRLGWILLVWGNCETGEELIADHTDTKFFEGLTEGL
jgi:hypothetical protein